MVTPHEAKLYTSGKMNIVPTKEGIAFQITLRQPIGNFRTLSWGSYWQFVRWPAAFTLRALPPASQELTDFVEGLYHMICPEGSRSRAEGLKLTWRDPFTVALIIDYGQVQGDALPMRVLNTVSILTTVFEWGDDAQVTSPFGT